MILIQSAKFAAILAATLILSLTLGTPALAAPKHPKAYLAFAADKYDATIGETVLLSWSSVNTRFCQASGDWEGKVPIEGTYRTPPLDRTKTFTLKCNAQGGGVEQTITISAVDEVAAPPLPKVTFTSANPSVIGGDSTTLSWSATNAENCSAGGGWSGTKATSGSESVAPLSDTTYTLLCTGDGGSDSASVSVAVNAEPPKLSFTAADSSVASGDSTTLSWSATDAENCSASGGWSGTRAASGSETVGPLNAGTTYSLSCNGPGGSVVQMLNIAVISSVSLAWEPPVENVDGTELTDLAGFRIYFGASSGSYTNMVEIADPAVTTATLDLSSGDYHVVMTAFDMEGNESSYSNEVLKTAP